MLLESLRSFAKPHRVIPVLTLSNETDSFIDRLNDFDCVILGGGGLFRNGPPPPFDTFDKWYKRLARPISVLGLGIERLEARFVEATDCLIEQADFFVVRDEESRRLAGNPKVRVAPDLTFFQPIPESRRAQTQRLLRCGINLRPHRYGTSEWTEVLSTLPFEKIPLPFSITALYDEREPISQITPTCRSMASLREYEDLDLVIGTAFHSIVAAIQAGVPAIAINYHPKVRRLMDEVGLGEFVLEWDAPHLLSQSLSDLLNRRDEIRAIMRTYTARASLNVAETLAEVREVIDHEMQGLLHQAINLQTGPTVTVLMYGDNAEQEEIVRSVTSCWNQTCSHIETVVIDCPDVSGIQCPGGVGSGDIKHLLSSELEHYLSSAAIGEYVMWLKAGSWLSEDAIARFLKRLKGRPDAQLVYSNYFLTVEDHVERRVNITIGERKDCPIALPGIFAHRSFVKSLWNQLSLGPAFEVSDRLLKQYGVHEAQPLVFRPATEGERLLFRAAISYGRDSAETAGRILEEAVELNPSIASCSYEFDKEFAAFHRAGGHPRVASDPAKYFEGICRSLPRSTRDLSAFARRFIGRASLELAFIYRERGEWSRVRASLINWLRSMPELPLNRGALWLGVESLVGCSLTSAFKKRWPRL